MLAHAHVHLNAKRWCVPAGDPPLKGNASIPSLTYHSVDSSPTLGNFLADPSRALWLERLVRLREVTDLCCSTSNPCKLFWAPHSTVLADGGGSVSCAPIGAVVNKNKRHRVISQWSGQHRCASWETASRKACQGTARKAAGVAHPMQLHPMSDDIDIRFRHMSGTDVGPFRIGGASSVQAVKERLLAEWPKGVRKLCHCFRKCYTLPVLTAGHCSPPGHNPQIRCKL